MHDDLKHFIEQARQKGIDVASIFLLLRAKGWKDREVAEVMAGQELGLEIPERPGVGSARDVFFHLIAFTALYAWVIALIYLTFTYIEFAFPDPAQRVSDYAIESALAGIRASLATLIVSYPVFLGIWWFLLREIGRFPEKAKSAVRRWLSSMTLFVAAVTVMGDLTTVVYYLVEGDLTTRFLLKVVVLFVITAAVFGYLAQTLRSEGEAGT